MKDVFLFSQLIIKDKLKALTEDDKADLESLKQKLHFSKEINFEDLVDKVSAYSEIDKNKAWEGILAKYQRIKNKKVFTLFRRPWHKYAAAIVVGILVSAYFIKNDIFNSTITDEVTPVVVNTEVIEPGSDKATLTLEDGSEITLEKGAFFQTKNANSNGQEIIYNAGDDKNKKIAYNYMTIPRGGQYYIVLSDGTRVWLNSETQLKYPVAFIAGVDRQVELIYGEAYFDVSPSSLHNGAKFKVLNKSQEIEVIGTEFNIKAYRDEAIVYTTLVEGTIEVSNSVFNKILEPSQQSQINPKTDEINVNEIDVYREISWKEGVFSFKDKSLKDIMRVLSRWYDIKVIFKNKDLEKVAFNGSLDKKLSISEVLSILGSTNNINYVINNKIVLLK